MLFEDEPQVRPLIKFVFSKYGVITVEHWDDAGGVRLLDEFQPDPQVRKKFLDIVGVPRNARVTREPRVVAFCPGR
jgi:hypothetical protein